MKKRLLLAFSLILFSFSVTGAQQTAAVASWNLKGLPAIPPTRATGIAGAIRSLNPEIIVPEVNPDSVATDIKNQLAGYRLAFVVQAAPPLGFCESLKTLAVAKDFRPNGPLASVRIPGAEYVRIDPLRGYFAVLGDWALDASGKLDPRDKASLLKRVETLTKDVAYCFPDWTDAIIVQSESRPELVGGSAFVKEGRTIEVQVYDDLDEGFKVRIQVLAPGALAAPNNPSGDLCPSVNQVIAAHGNSLDFGPLKKSPPTPPGARSSRVITLPPPEEYQYEAVFGEWTFIERPSPAQMKEIQESLQSLTVDVGVCLSPKEWTPLQRPPSRGNLGAVEFTRGKTLVKVTGYLTPPWKSLVDGKTEDPHSSITVALYVMENKR